MEEIRIPNSATYSPVSLLELGLAAPLVSRLLLRSTPVGLALQTAALALYAGSVVDDWLARSGVRRIDFRTVFGADVRRLPTMPVADREAEVRVLVERLNAMYTPERIPRPELARRVDVHLTEVIAGVTGQRVRTSTEIRGVSLMSVVFPFALGTADILSGDVAILRDTGIFEPHVIVHEFVHRKGYWKELHAQVLAYLALAGSGDPVLVQAALAERLARQLTTLEGDDPAAVRARVRAAGLIEPVERQLVSLRGRTPDPISGAVSDAMKQLYD
ncbi:MAG: hypothetical protein GWM90_18355, partial [Gemmatimonadetes bacterium]|nr:hypothetical protein [Gemmatimonadota bacterium]NIQ56328.1 hypothetical protein [Gemmatimonadota bacterium]NIU76518.1 hypothetical protein [Gammaproteobacteria bacterium]NIX45983.1 hypothetical protein [Gemmatimonadota bacterium]NIY10298.1 hypothetical protein [Gemmatimonadota bacterium]